MWAIGPPPGDDSGNWLVGLHFFVKDGYPILVEQKIMLDNGIESMLTDPWSTAAPTSPDELTATILRSVNLGDMQKQVRAALSSHKETTWGEGLRDAYDDREPPPNWSEHDEFTRVTGVDTTNTTHRSKRGRPALTDLHLALVAYHYDHAFNFGEPIHNYIWSKMNKGGEDLPIRQWVIKARRRGFLTPTTKPGKPGGTITPKAIETLKRSGPLNIKDEPMADQKGATQ